MCVCAHWKSNILFTALYQSLLTEYSMFDTSTKISHKNIYVLVYVRDEQQLCHCNATLFC
jgi:hypothetical protein